MAYKYLDHIQVYALIDPRNGQIRYIGKTDCPRRRFNEHIRPSMLQKNNRHNAWIKSLIREDLKPIWQPIEDVTFDSWVETEQFWIGYFKMIGCHLTNETVGGDGAKGWSKPQSPEHKAKIRSSLLGKKKLPDHCRAMSEGQIRYFKNHISNRKGARHTDETRAKMSAAAMGNQKWLGRHHSEASKLKIAKSRARPIVCFATGRVYDSAAAAAREFAISRTHMRRKIGVSFCYDPCP